MKNIFWRITTPFLILIMLEIFTLCSLYSDDLYKQVDFLLAGYRDSNDAMLSGGKVYTYSAGTLSAETLATNKEGSAFATNPIILDTYGRAEVFGNGIYKFVIKTSDDESVETIDGAEYKMVSSDQTSDLETRVDDLEDTVNTDIPLTYLKLDCSNDPLTADLDMDSNNITNVGTPTLTHEAVNKEYADTKLDGYGISGTPNTGEVPTFTGTAVTWQTPKLGSGSSPSVKITYGEYSNANPGSNPFYIHLTTESEFTAVYTGGRIGSTDYWKDANGVTYEINFTLNGVGFASHSASNDNASLGQEITKNGYLTSSCESSSSQIDVGWLCIGIRKD